MSFSKNIDEIINEIKKSYQNLFPTADVSQGSLLFIKAKAFGAALWGLYQYLDKAVKQIFPDTADTHYLEHHANIWDITRKTGETDASLLERLSLRRNRPPAGGNKYDYKRWAESVSGVKKAYVFTPDSVLTVPIPLGIVEVVVLANAGSGYTQEVPSSSILTTVQNVIDENRPVTQYFTNVVSPKNFIGENGLFLIDTEIKVNAGNFDTSRLTSSIKVYLNSLAPNEILYNDKITSICVRQGAKDTDIIFSTTLLYSSYLFTTDYNVITASDKYSFDAVQLTDIIWPKGDSGITYGSTVISKDENTLKLYLDKNYTGTTDGTVEIQRKFTNIVNFNISSDIEKDITYTSISFSWSATWSGAIGKQWHWDFGDGYTSTDEYPSHTYTEAGEYKVKCKILFINQNEFIYAQNELTITISELLSAPNASFSTDKIAGNNPTTITFQNKSVGDISLYEWDFGDGNTSTEENPTHTYTAPGNYSVSLKTTGLGGVDDLSKTDAITIHAAGTPPTADFTANHLTVKKGELIYFTDKSVGAVDSWAWDFGDGSISTQQHTKHIYTQPGRYTVILTVTDSDSQSDTIEKLSYIHVIDESIAIVEKENVIPSNHQMIRFGTLLINKA